MCRIHEANVMVGSANGLGCCDIALIDNEIGIRKSNSVSLYLKCFNTWLTLFKILYCCLFLL